MCGSDLAKEFKCCGSAVKLDDHDRNLSPQYVIYCPSCGESLAGASCDTCGKVYTWKLGIVPSHQLKKPRRSRTKVAEKRP